MNPLITLLILTLCAVAMVFTIRRIYRNSRRFALANIGEGRCETGSKSYRTDAAISTRYLLAKIGSDAGHVALAGTADIPIGTITDEAAAAEDLVNIHLLGAGSGTRLVVASAAITAGDMVVSAASGKVRTLPGTTGTYYIIGRALNAAGADGDLVEISPCFPTQRVV